MPAPSQRPYQIVVWGANGFTGSLVCEHIATAYTGDVRWALAGRNRAKLERLRDRLSNINPACKDVPIVVVDMADRKSVDRMVKQTDVIVATAGPFSRVGTAVVESSVRQGTHYCDITGETLWVRKMICQFHHQAEARKVKIVHCCGFDSIPSDLGTLMVVDHMRQKLHRSCGRLEVLFGQCKGGVSGGSIATTLDEFSAPYSEEEMASLHDPYCLDPPSSRRGPDIQDYWGVAYNPYAKSWTFPHCWSRVNSRIVRRSNALQDHRYGKHFRYREAAEAEGPVDALLGTLAVSFVHFLTAFHPARELVRALLPKPGEGPPPEFQQNGYWSVRLLGFTNESDPGRKPSRVEAVVGGRRDPGYWETSRMLLESGLCLALDGEELQQQQDLQPGGVLTPATAMGHVLIRRLRRSGMSFEINSPDPPSPPANAAPSARPDPAGLDRSAAAAVPSPSAPAPSPPAPDARAAGRPAAGRGAGLARPPSAIARLARFRLWSKR